MLICLCQSMWLSTSLCLLLGYFSCVSVFVHLRGCIAYTYACLYMFVSLPVASVCMCVSVCVYMRRSSSLTFDRREMIRLSQLIRLEIIIYHVHRSAAQATPTNRVSAAAAATSLSASSSLSPASRRCPAKTIRLHRCVMDGAKCMCQIWKTTTQTQDSEHDETRKPRTTHLKQCLLQTRL